MLYLHNALETWTLRHTLDVLTMDSFTVPLVLRVRRQPTKLVQQSPFRWVLQTIKRFRELGNSAHINVREGVGAFTEQKLHCSIQRQAEEERLQINGRSITRNQVQERRNVLLDHRKICNLRPCKMRPQHIPGALPGNATPVENAISEDDFQFVAYLPKCPLIEVES